MRTCDNCGRPVLESDVICWHCGYELQPPPADAAPAAEASEDDAEEVPQAFPLPATVAYGLLTAVLILAALFVMQSLGQQPVVALNPETSSAGWTAVTDAALRFTLDLPDEWTWRLTTDTQPFTLDDELVAGVPLATAVAPFGDLVDDTEILLVAASDDTAVPGFLVVARSQRLSALTAEEAASFLDTLSDADVEVVATSSTTNLAGLPQVRYGLNHPNVGQQCENLYVPLADASYLVGACGPRITRYQLVFANILDSFQPLGRSVQVR